MVYDVIMCYAIIICYVIGPHLRPEWPAGPGHRAARGPGHAATIKLTLIQFQPYYKVYHTILYII